MMLLLPLLPNEAARAVDLIVAHGLLAGWQTNLLACLLSFARGGLIFRPR